MMRPSIAIAVALSAFGVSASAQAPTPVQTIALFSYGYTPTTISLRAGQPVTLNFVNRSGHAHDFTAAAFFARSRIMSGRIPRGEIELRGGQSMSVTLVPARGTFPVHCGHFMHKQFGMRGVIVVR